MINLKVRVRFCKFFRNIKDIKVSLLSLALFRNYVVRACLDFPLESIVNKLQETVKLLTADNEEKQNALVDARAEVKELKEFMESVSTVSVCSM